MKIYVPWVQENDYETESYDLGAFSSIEKAEKAIVEELRELGQEVLTLDIYQTMEDPAYIFGIHEFTLDN